MAPDPVTVAIIGTGLIGPRHAQTVLEDPNTILTAIVDPLPHGEQIAQRFNVPWHKSISSLIASTDKPLAAIICTPNHTHVPIALDLVSAGIHVLVEKPISVDISSGETLICAARNKGVNLLVGHHRRFNPYVVAAKEVIYSGRLGAITAVNGMWTTYKPPSYFDPPGDWRRDGVKGGVVMINLIHDVDLLQALAGPITRVYAEGTPKRRGFDAEEGAAITFRFESGAVGSFLLCDNVPSPHNFEAGTGENPLLPKVGKDFYRIFGTEGMLSVPDLTVWSYGVQKSWQEVMRMETADVDEGIVPFKAQLTHFVKVVRRGEEPQCSGEMGLAALKVCEAVKESLRTGMPVRISRRSVVENSAI
ncbi:hypothetical protein H2198_000612 [Neophaeococcomyces mojaviensis]|uniref:Uncharacterized protein n=1 Tax=Neophaeococcomyces mojaviensis TaxID=3383035 RepID=A0ACC3AJD2_9EURO|nr:hypothetical protein H2198_000612 [Knufia sp. JES_112]